MALATPAADAVGAGAATTVPLLLPTPAPGGALFLRLNADVSVAGTLRVAILDAATGLPLPGFSSDDCAPLHGNGIRQLVTCKGAGEGGDLADLAARDAPLLLHFDMVHTKLYAWQLAAA